MLLESDDPDRFAVGSVLHTDDDPSRTLTVVARRWHRNRLAVRFEGIDGRQQAESLAGRTLLVDATQRRQLASDEFWPDELQGLEVRDPAGETLGRVEAVELGEEQDRLIVVTAAGRRVWIPFVSRLVPVVDLDGGYVVVDPIEGLLSPPPD